MNDWHFPDLMISGMPVKLWAAHPPPQDLAVQQQHLHLQVISYPQDTRNLQELQQQKRNSNRKRRKVEKVAGDWNILVADYFSASLSDTRNIIKITQQEAQSCSLSHPHIFIRLFSCASKENISLKLCLVRLSLLVPPSFAQMMRTQNNWDLPSLISVSLCADLEVFFQFHKQGMLSKVS